MLKTKKMLSLFVAVVLSLSVLLTGCSKKEAKVDAPAATATPTAADANDPSKLPKVELVYYIINSPQTDLEAVNAKLNELVEKKINATVKLKLIDWGSYEQTLNLAIAGNENWDLAWSFSNNYFQNVPKGAFADLTDLLDKYLPKTKAGVPQNFWTAVTVKGKAYAVPVFQQATPGYGYIINKAIADKNQIDWKAPKSLADLTPILDKIKKSNKELVTFGVSQQDDPFTRQAPLFGMEALGDAQTPGWIHLNDNSLKVVNQYETQEFKDYLKLMRSWYQKGYIRSDAATLKDMQADSKAGKIATKWAQVDLGTDDWKNAGLEFKGRLAAFNPTVESYDAQFVKPILTTDKATATLTVINANSKNKERAAMFIELLNNDKDVYNTLCYGVEGKHYKKVSDNRVEMIPNSGYAMYSNWEFGNMSNQYYSDSDAKGAEVDDKGNKMWIDINKNAPASPALGFTFDFSPVKTEKTQIDAVISQYYYALSFGTLDVDKTYPTFIAKLKAAGADKVIAEKQKQIDQWKVDNKK